MKSGCDNIKELLNYAGYKQPRNIQQGETWC